MWVARKRIISILSVCLSMAILMPMAMAQSADVDVDVDVDAGVGVGVGVGVGKTPGDGLFSHALAALEYAVALEGKAPVWTSASVSNTLLDSPNEDSNSPNTPNTPNTNNRPDGDPEEPSSNPPQWLQWLQSLRSFLQNPPLQFIHFSTKTSFHPDPLPLKLSAAHQELLQRSPATPSDPPAVLREKAVHFLNIAAHDHDNQNALFLLAEMNLHSKYFHPRNVSAALHYYAVLANSHGNATAQRVFGLMHATGVGVKRDYSKALLYLSFAALGNDLLAHQTLGYWYNIGIAVPKSCEDALWHYKIIADKLLEEWFAGPPGGRTVPPAKVRLPDEQGGIFGAGASGQGAPAKLLPQTSEAHRTVREIFEITAQEGDWSMQLELARLYYSGGQHTPRNYKSALKYFLLASRAFAGKRPSGEINPALKVRVTIASIAASYLGTMYWRGEGVAKDETIARQWFERGEELGNGMSLNGLGMMILQGAGGFEVNYEKAIEYFTLAIQRDYPAAYVNLAELTLQIGSTDALATAYKYFAASTAKPPASVLALYRLGEFHADGLGGVPQNCMTALGYYKSLVEKADWHDPQLRRAHEHYTYAQKTESHADMESAFLLYLFAAERGYEVAQTNAAWMIDTGLMDGGKIRYPTVATNDDPSSVQVDYTNPIVGGALEIHANDMYEVALVLWNRAANQGNVDARVKMGDYHYYGLGLKSFEALDEDATEAAHAHLHMKPRTFATKDGVVGAVQKLVMPYWSKHDAILNEPRFDKAALYYQVAADESSALAQWNIGFMHENGIGVAKDFPLAKRMYDMAFATNPESYLAVYAALTKLGIKTRIAGFMKALEYYFSHSFLRDTLKKHGFMDEIEEFQQAGAGGYVKGAIPASASEHLEEIGGIRPGSKALPGSVPFEAKLDGLYQDAMYIAILCGVAGLLFLYRQYGLVAPVPPGPVPGPAPGLLASATPVGATAEAGEASGNENGHGPLEVQDGSLQPAAGELDGEEDERL